MISRPKWLLLASTLVFVARISSFAAALDRPAGEPLVSGREPGTQQESDWVDNRWAQTDIGPFLASNLRLPGGPNIAKALTVKAGAGSVVYDTATMTLAGGWLDGFVVPDAGRFGLIGAPKPGGNVLKPGEALAWTGGMDRFVGIHSGARATVLEFESGGRRVLEAAEVRKVDGSTVFLRTWEIGSGVKAISLTNSVRSNWARQEMKLSGRAVTVFTGSAAAGMGALLVEGNLAEPVIAPGSTRQRVTAIWTEKPVEAAQMAGWLASLDLGAVQPSELAKPGVPRWLPALETRGELGVTTGPLAVDTLTVPYANPWKALMFLAGVDFTPDGAAFVCTIHGDVWRVTGVDKDLRKLTWKRFATGLYQPLGLKVVKGEVYVLGRDRITRLKDSNGDGEADFYENFCDLIQTSTGGHDYVTSLEVDSSGNFYFVDPKGVHRVSPDGKKLETIATGFRNPNGMGVRPDGAVVTVAPQQGEWTPSSFIAEARQGNYFGHGGPRKAEQRPLGFDAPLCWLPHGVDNSSGGQAWIPEGQWGPLGGQMIHLSWGRCFPMVVLRDTAGSIPQGLAMALPAKFLSGPNRATWNPKDKALYVAGSTGWQTGAVKDGSLQRVRWMGKNPVWPVGWTATKGGIEVRFSAPLRRETAEDVGSYGLKWWNYRYAAQYGSKDWSVSSPDKEGRDEVPIAAAKLASDGKTVFLSIPSLQPVNQFELKWNLEDASGKPVPGTVYGTINQLR